MRAGGFQEALPQTDDKDRRPQQGEDSYLAKDAARSMIFSPAR